MGGNLSEMGRIVLIVGLLMVAVGAALIVAGRIGIPLGRLPGDFAYRGKHVSVFLPLGTSLLLSILLSLVLYLLSRFRG